MKKKTPGQFSKFEQKRSNAAKKESFRQEKRQLKKEREAFFEKKKNERPGPAGKTFRNRDGASPERKAPAIRRKETVEQMPLNKYLAHAGICGRREAAELVKKGLVKVNGAVILEPGHKVMPRDEVKFNGKKVFPSRNLVYILLNKPKDYITTTDDERGRKTVLQLIARATQERIYPVGRLDRNTSGVLLLTNDGELAQKLTHPSHEIKKVYSVTLDKPLDKKDFERILAGVVLEDGPARVDALAFSNQKDRSEVGIEIHSGKNRIVRRIFEHLGYQVRNLDRVIFAGLTKKNVDRGKWRFLSEKEVRDLKYFGKGK
jgi:23S rRNA pseudouridine2605 synthase